MANINEGRWTAHIDGDFVVFIIGAKLRNPFRALKALPIMAKMPKMLKEIEAEPEHGLLGFQRHGGQFGVIVQYWRSFEALENYARNPKAEHAPVWRAWNRAAQHKNGSVGIWHETFRVPAGAYEAIYTNMATIGLAKAGTAVTVEEAKYTARARLGLTEPAALPVPSD
ncbi:MAG: hypothetical protein JWM40_1821 [Frankiales bacterium]|nr:hypothetical protein [Frankiales bacterium]